MNSLLLRPRTVASIGLRLAILMALLLPLALAAPARAQETAGATTTPAVEAPPSLIE